MLSFVDVLKEVFLKPYKPLPPMFPYGSKQLF